MARRPHPYFGRINRLEAMPAPVPGKPREPVPPRTPDDVEGVLWDGVRDTLA